MDSSTGTIASIIIDFIVVVQDWAFDINTVYLFAVAQHYKWTASAIFFMYLPGVTLFVAKHFDNQNYQPADSNWKRHLINTGTLLVYPVVIVYMGLVEIWNRDGRRIKHFKQLKCYDGLLESSFMFMMQLVVICQRTPIGDFDVLGLGLVIPNGKFWLMLIGLFSSLLGFLYNMSEYHVLCDDHEPNVCRQLKLMPYYSVHFLFRSFTFAMFWIYWREMTIPTFIFLCLLNMWLTRHTYMTDVLHPCNHVNFCTLVGGFSAMMSPCFAVFFTETTSARNLNYFYKRNILLTNGLFLLLFGALALHLNVNPHEHIIVKNDKNNTPSHEFGLDEFKQDSFNYVRRNVLFSCKDRKLPWTNHEFSLPVGWTVNSTDLYSAPFLSSTDKDGCSWWWTRIAKGAENHTRYFFCPHGKSCDNKTVDWPKIEPDHYLVSQPCHENENEIDRFNKYVAPIVIVSGLVSTCLALYKFEMIIDK